MVNMFVNRRQYYQGYPYLSAYTQAQIQQYRQNALATQAKLQVYRDAILQEARNRNQANPPPVSLLRTTAVGSTCQTPVNDHDFTPVGHVSRAGSTPQSYHLWSSSESGSETDYSHRKNFSRNLCRVITICSILLFILGVFGIIGIAIYFGYASDFAENEISYSDSYVGKLSILKGDSWMPELAVVNSPSFKAKSNKYKNMLSSVYEVSILGLAFRGAEVNKFSTTAGRNSLFEINFRITLDRRKIPWRLPNTERVVEDILLQEIGSLSPVAFQKVKVDRDAIHLRKESNYKDSIKDDPNRKSYDTVVEVVPIITGAGTILKKIAVDNRPSTLNEILITGTPKYVISPSSMSTTVDIPTRVIPTKITTTRDSSTRSSSNRASLSRSSSTRGSSNKSSSTRVISATVTTTSPISTTATMTPATLNKDTTIKYIPTKAAKSKDTTSKTTTSIATSSPPINFQDDKTKNKNVRNQLKQLLISSTTASSTPLISEMDYIGNPWNLFRELEKISATSSRPIQIDTINQASDSWNPLTQFSTILLTTTRPSTISNIKYNKDHWAPFHPAQSPIEPTTFQWLPDTTVKTIALNKTSEAYDDTYPMFGTLTVIEAPKNLASVNDVSSSLSNVIQELKRPNSNILNSFSLTDEISKTPIKNREFSSNNVSTHSTVETLKNNKNRRIDAFTKNNANHEFIVHYPNSESSHESALTNEVKKPPTKNDIRSILENLLFYSSDYKNSSSVWNNLRRLFKSDNVNTTEKVNNELIIPTTSNPTTKSKLPTNKKSTRKPFRYVQQAKDFREIYTPVTRKQLPIDKFRNKAKQSNKILTTKPHATRNKLWHFLTTHKPLILDTQVVTSKSTNVEYGTTAHLRPVYFSTTTRRTKQNNVVPGTLDDFKFPHIEVPVFWKNKISSIKINRTRDNYPNVVIVNLPKYKNMESSISEGRYLKEDSIKISDFFNRINKRSKFTELVDKIFDSNQPIENSTLVIFVNILSSSNFLLNETVLGMMKISNEGINSNIKSNDIINSEFNINIKPGQPFGEDNHLGNLLIEEKNVTQSENIINNDHFDIFVKPNNIQDSNREGKEVKYTTPTYKIRTSSTNSPIHTFSFKEDQTLEDLLLEIFENIPNEEDAKHAKVETQPSIIHSNKAVGQMDNKSIPPGEDYLLFIEALSNVLSGSANNYNMVFDNQYNEIKSDNNKKSDEEIKLPNNSIGMFKANVTNNTIPDKTKPLNNYNHSYKHELFPVLTRPYNHIRTTTPTVLMDLQENDTFVTTVSNKVVTSYNVSYSIHSQLNNFSIPFLPIDGLKDDCNPNEFKCRSGDCIKLELRCNMQKNCEDNSDESSCTCADSLKNQEYTTKICDGIIDCWDNSDENSCDWCSADEFICSGAKKCISRKKICDAVADCPNGDDEKDCVKIAPSEQSVENLSYYNEGYLMVRREGIWGKFCIENFENTITKAGISWEVKDLGEAVCHTLTYDSFNGIIKEKDKLIMGAKQDSMPFYEMNITINSDAIPRSRFDTVLHHILKRSIINPHSNSKGIVRLNKNLPTNPMKRNRRKRQTVDAHLGLQFQEASCPSREILKIRCQALQCGIRPRAVTQQARIVGGTNSSPGAWPWHAALYKEGEYQCGATLISEYWLISAGHCFYKGKDDFWMVRMGALRRGTKFPSPFEQVRSVSHIFIHPDYVHQGYINDISLVKVAKAIEFNDYIRPVCLPAPGTEVNDGQRCTLVGWGQLFEVKKVFPDTLQEVEVPLISTNECRKRTVFLPLYRITEDMFCAGYARGGRDACLGDSGGPLMCQKPNGQWEVVGITSNGYGCARPHHPGVYTKLANYLTWIVQIIEIGKNYRVIPIERHCEGIRCPLGQCLPRSSVCNGIWECSDGSDESTCNN